MPTIGRDTKNSKVLLLTESSDSTLNTLQDLGSAPLDSSGGNDAEYFIFLTARGLQIHPHALGTSYSCLMGSESHN